MKNILRKESLERLASPEQLDRLLTIIRLPGWISLFCLLVIILGILIWSIFGQLPITTSGLGVFFDLRSIEVIQSESEGVIEEVHVEIGDFVKKGAPLLTIRAPRTQFEQNEKTTQLENKLGNENQKAQKPHNQINSRVLRAPDDGRILMIEVLRGEDVRFGKTLLWFQEVEKLDEKELVYGFFSIEKGDQIKPGMQVQIMFDSVRSELYGKMEGIVKEVLPFSVSLHGDILQSIPSQSLREYLSKKEASVGIVIEPIFDSKTPSGYKWTTKEGPPYRIHTDSVADVTVFLGKKRPISYLIPVGID